MEPIINHKKLAGSIIFIRSLLVGLTLAFPAHAAWTDVSPGAVVLDFAVSPSNQSILFATAVGGSNGVWRSLNSGGSWTRVVSGTDYNGTVVAPDTSSLVLAGVQNGAVQRSTSGGDIGTWMATSGSANEEIWRYSFSLSSPDTVYAGGFTNGPPDTGKLQRSTNDGANWNGISIASDANPPVLSVAVHPSNASIVYVGADPAGGLNAGLYKSTNGGASFNLLASLPFTAVDALAVDPNNGSIVYAGTHGLGLIKRSVDGGTTWQDVHNPATDIAAFTGVKAIAVNPADSRIIYATGGSAAIGGTKVIVSTDCGVSWTVVDSTGIGADLPSKIQIDPVNDFVFVMEAVTNGKIYREALAGPASGSCPTGGSGGGGGSSSSSGSGSSSGAVDYILLSMLAGLTISRGLLRFRRRKKR